MKQEFRWMGQRQAMLLTVLAQNPQTVRELQAALDERHHLQLEPRAVLSLLDGLHARSIVETVDWDAGHGWSLRRTPEAEAVRAAACARFQASQATEKSGSNSTVKSTEGSGGTVTASSGVSEVR